MANTDPSFTALDRNVALGLADEPALTAQSWVTGTRRTLTFAQLTEQVAQLAGVLRVAGITVGDLVAVLLPPGLERVVAELACVRGGTTLATDPESAALTILAWPGPDLDRVRSLQPSPQRLVVAAEASPLDRAAFGDHELDYRAWMRSSAIQPSEVIARDGVPISVTEGAQELRPPVLEVLERLAQGQQVAL